MRFVKEVVFLKIINANSFLVVKKRESLIFNRKRVRKIEKLKDTLCVHAI